MSNKGSAHSSSSPSPSPSPETEAHAQLEEKKEEEKSKEQSELPESNSASDESKSPSPEERKGAAQEAEASSSTPAEPSTSKTTKEEEGFAEPDPVVPANALVQGDWQAIWSPQHGMYYFYNMRTNETTWTNPVAPSDASVAASAYNSARMSAEEAAAAAGIDPELVFLDPTLVAGPSAPNPFAFTAKFNARTGAFAKPDARNPDHVSEYERMKRMNNFYFDMDAWQREVEQRQEEEEAGKKRKKPTKKDLEMFKERKRQKKLAKTAWLRT